MIFFVNTRFKMQHGCLCVSFLCFLFFSLLVFSFLGFFVWLVGLLSSELWTIRMTTPSYHDFMAHEDLKLRQCRCQMLTNLGSQPLSVHIQGSLYYQPKCILKGKSTNITISLHCIDTSKMVPIE